MFFQKLANEIKHLIKEQKKEGKKGVLDLTSRDVSEKLSERRELKKRRSNLGDDSDDYDNETKASGLFTAMTQQLAWEKDIDLTTKNTTVMQEITIKEEDEDFDESNQTSRTTLDMTSPPLSTGKNRRSSSGTDNKVFMTDSSAESVPMKSIHDVAFGNVRKGSKVSPETSYIDDESSSSSSGPKKYKKNKRPPTGRSGSSGSKGSKDSDDKQRRTNLALTGSKSSLNSASSLTSLLHAWDKDSEKQKTSDF